jgi:hypothetical protein
VLDFYVGGETADKLEAMTLDEAVESATKQLQKVSV